MSHQALLDVADVCEEIADCRDLEKWNVMSQTYSGYSTAVTAIPERVTVTRARLEGEM